jgi:hypothetical protein
VGLVVRHTFFANGAMFSTRSFNHFAVRTKFFGWDEGEESLEIKVILLFNEARV